MSYSLISTNGEVVHIASVQGLSDVVDFITRLIPSGAVRDFFDSGETDDIPTVIRQLTLIAPYATNQDVRTTLIIIRNALESVQPLGWAAIGE